jgi:hypothetical protein
MKQRLKSRMCRRENGKPETVRSDHRKYIKFAHNEMTHNNKGVLIVMCEFDSLLKALNIW